MIEFFFTLGFVAVVVLYGFVSFSSGISKQNAKRLEREIEEIEKKYRKDLEADLSGSDSDLAERVREKYSDRY